MNDEARMTNGQLSVVRCPLRCTNSTDNGQLANSSFGLRHSGFVIRHFMDHLNKRFDSLGVRFGENAVAQIEDVPRAAGRLREDIFRSHAERVEIGEKRDWVEISLHAPVISNLPPTL